MLKRCITSQTGQKPIETAALNRGAAVILCSTKSLPLYRESPLSDTCHRRGAKRDELYSLLQKRNCFSATLAKRPAALVIRTEGKNKPLYSKGVTTWA